MTITATELIHLPSLGNLASCRDRSDVIFPAIKKMYDESAIKGYTIVIIKNEDEADSHMLPNNFLEITKGTYPFLYILIQPQNEDTAFDARISFLKTNEYVPVVNE